MSSVSTAEVQIELSLTLSKQGQSFKLSLAPSSSYRNLSCFSRTVLHCPPHTQKSRGMWLPSHTEVTELILRRLFILPVTLAEDEQTRAQSSSPSQAGAAIHREWNWLYSPFSLILCFQENDTLETMGHFQSVTTAQDLCRSPTHSQLYKKTQQKKSWLFIYCMFNFQWEN